ncbi:hypothetical protein A9Q84_09690 [Halobacteriovorax marinus]|uniref:Pseudouridine synthase RsuA/RluA-like domain-containing protein n=1 Tax=Halobacteriovorax marinus TaxID=97084 RepID=A0A1Y5F6S7_9BACT|nr:hypothetical protein A9Q84_09690 [Halobacteriovorax marinus]
MSQEKFSFRTTVPEGTKTSLVDYLSEKTPLSKIQLKKLAANGGVWIRRKGKGPLTRVRRAKSTLSEKDYVECHYDPAISEVDTSGCREIFNAKTWGVWYKPAGILSQGTKFGDQASILRVVEKDRASVFLIQRLDRETSGLMVIAYKEKVARIFNKALRSQLIREFFQAEVLGQLRTPEGEITLKLEGKSANTLYKVHKEEEHSSLVEIEITTGRFHQIRQHFTRIKNPIIGDPKYGKDNKNDEGLKLVAHKVEVKDPISKEDHVFELPRELRLF